MLSERPEHVACGGFSAKDLAHAKEKPWRYTAVACEVGLPLYGLLGSWIASWLRNGHRNAEEK